MHFKKALHFAALVHICIGVVFWYFLLNLLDTIIHKSTNSNMEALLMGVQYFVYLFLFLPLGCLIYRGVKKESVPILQYSSIGFFLLQIYGLFTQLQHGFLLSSFSTSVSSLFPKSQGLTAVELGSEAGLTVVYIILTSLYIRQLRSHFYVPPIYSSRNLEYFYEQETCPPQTSVFQIQVPCILGNYQTGAYFVERKGEREGKPLGVSRHS